MIISYPLELNKIRDLSSLCTVLDANKLMRDHNHLKRMSSSLQKNCHTLMEFWLR